MEPAGTGRLIVCLRNPKDVLTSLHFFRGEAKDGWRGNEHGLQGPRCGIQVLVFQPARGRVFSSVQLSAFVPTAFAALSSRGALNALHDTGVARCLHTAGPGSLPRFCSPQCPNAYGSVFEWMLATERAIAPLAASGRVLVVYYEVRGAAAGRRARLVF